MKKKLVIALGALLVALNVKAVSHGAPPVISSPLVKVGDESISSSSVSRCVLLNSGHEVEYLGIVDRDYSTERYSWRVRLCGGQVDGGIYCSGDLHLFVESDTTLNCSGNTCGIDVNGYGALYIHGPGKLRIECAKGTGIRCANSAEFHDIELENACVEIVRKESGVGIGTLGGLGYGIYTDFLFAEDSTMTIFLNDGHGDAICCNNLDIRRSVVMAAGGKRGLFAQGVSTVIGSKADKDFADGNSRNGYVNVVGGALYLQGNTIGAAIGGDEHIGDNTIKGCFSAKDSVVVVCGLETDGICCGGSVVLDNVAGSIRAAQCAIRAFDDIDIKGNSALNFVGNVADSGAKSNSNPNLGAALLVARTGAENGFGGGAINVDGGRTVLFSNGCVGAFTPGVFSVTGGKITVSSGKRTADLHHRYTASDGEYFRRQLCSKAGISPPTSQGSNAANEFLGRWKVFGGVNGSWSPVAHGIDAQAYKQTGGTCEILNASSFGLLLGWKHSGGSGATDTSRLGSGRLEKSGGTLSIREPGRQSVASGNTCISSMHGSLKGTSTMTFSGGLTTLVGGLNCLTCNGKVTLKKGTINYFVRRAVTKPETDAHGVTAGMGVYAMRKITIVGGSLAVMGLTTGNGVVFHGYSKGNDDPGFHGAVWPRPMNSSGEPLYRAIFPVGGTDADMASISSMEPGYYCREELFPADGGNLMFWLPSSKARLSSQTRRTMTFRTSKKGVFWATVKNGSYQPISNGMIRKHDDNVFVKESKVRRSTTNGRTVVAKPKITSSLSKWNTITTPSSEIATPNFYIVKFHANGGKLPKDKKMPPQQFSIGKTGKLRKNVFQRNGFVFIGWAKKKGGAVAYKNAQSVKNVAPAGKTVTLYAKWAKKHYKVAFYANGGKGKMAAQKFTYGKAGKLAKNKFKNGDRSFLGWAKSGTLADAGTVVYKDCQSVKNLATNGKTVKLYAVWSLDYKVCFDANGGAGTMEAQTLNYGHDANLMINSFTREGCFFAGWARTENGEVDYANGQLVNNLALPGDTVALFAVWRPFSLYLVIDLSGGSVALSYPVSCLNSPPPGGFNTDEYKTTKLVLRKIENGAFTMGCESTEVGCSETPEYRYEAIPHKVSITKPFYMGVFEVTQKQWELVMGSNPASYCGETRPVETVSYDIIRGASSGALWPFSKDVDKSSFMGLLRDRTAVDGLRWDLPTEAMWEYACRAGTTTALNSGKNLTHGCTYPDKDSQMDEVGRYYDNRNDGKGGYNGSHTTVGAYLPNNWGLYDMHGNVLELTLDWYMGRDEAFSPYAETDPVGPYPTDPNLLGEEPFCYHVGRGGGWAFGASNCRSACRFSPSPRFKGDYSGLRLAAFIEW